MKSRPNNSWQWFFLFVAMIVAAGCETVVPPILPPTPRMVPYQGTPFATFGVRPDPNAPDANISESGGIILDWYMFTGAELSRVNVGGYFIYRSDSSDVDGRPVNFRRIARVELSLLRTDTTFVDTTAGRDHYSRYCVRAFEKSTLLEGPPSDTVEWILSSRPVIGRPIGTASSADRELKLEFGPQEVGGGKVAVQVLRVHPVNESIVYDTVWQEQLNAGFQAPSVTYAGEELIQGERYRWRVLKVKDSTAYGNSSSWVTFFYQ